MALCADDYGASPSISEGIEQLVMAGRLGAVSCLVNGPHWPRAAERLRHWPDTVALGLHFNLTEGVPLSAALRRIWPRFPGLGPVLSSALLRRLPHQAVACEWRTQFDAFVQAAGRRPAYVDGHQHVHHLPGVRPLLLQAQAQGPVAVRSTARLLGPGWAFKRRVIECTGGRALQAQLAAHGVAHNRWLTGAYDFQHPNYRGLMQAWLAALPPAAVSAQAMAGGALLFCHPALPRRPDEPPDAIAAARWREWQYLNSPDFSADLDAAAVTLVPAWQTSKPD